MNVCHYRDLIVRAVLGTAVATPADPEMVGKLADALAQAADGKQILRAKGYGDVGITVDAAARMVPSARLEVLDIWSSR